VLTSGLTFCQSSAGSPSALTTTSDFSVVIKIRKGAAAVGAGDGKAGLPRKRPSTVPFPRLAKRLVGLLVVRGLKQVN